MKSSEKLSNCCPVMVNAFILHKLVLCAFLGDCVFPCIALSWKYSQGIVGTVSLTSHDLKLGTGRDDLPRVACRLGGRAGLELVNFSQAASAGCLSCARFCAGR